MTFMLETDYILKVLSHYGRLSYLDKGYISEKDIADSYNYVRARRIVERHR